MPAARELTSAEIREACVIDDGEGKWFPQMFSIPQVGIDRTCQPARLQIINDSAAANIKDSAVAAIESHAMTPKGVEIFGSCARARLPSATTGLIVIGVI